MRPTAPRLAAPTRHGIIAPMIRMACVALGCSWLGVAQPPNQPPRKSAPAMTDTWQRSKECSVQAEKVMGEIDQRAVADGRPRSTDWNNHYSPKYLRCFVSASYFAGKSAVKGGPLFSATLLDAFERSIIASSASGGDPHVMCRSETDPAECEQIAKSLWKILCKIDDKETSCAVAEAFIEEHMKR